MAKPNWLQPEEVASARQSGPKRPCRAAILLDCGDHSRSCFIHNVEGGFGGTAKSTEAS
jgi:hypothetical protein